VTSVPQPLTLHAALRRAFRDARAPGSLATALTVDPEAAACVAERVAKTFIAEAEAAARAGERKRCIAFLRSEEGRRDAAAETGSPEAEVYAADSASFAIAASLLTVWADGLAAGSGEEGAGIEAEARADERRLCAMRLRDWAAGARQRREHVAATTAAWLANEIDPLGPVRGAPAAGGTT